jgi:ectoine hydroxylase-related dioxygenase (phytanoyl-CoA dioxygenase family)
VVRWSDSIDQRSEDENTVTEPEPADDATLAHFRAHGWLRVRGAFSRDEAAAMRSATWRALGNVGIRHDDPATWTKERPEHLQHVKADPVFRAVGSARLLEAIDTVLDGQAHEWPKNWGALFLAFPTRDRWNVPSRGWHADANYLSALDPPAGVRTHALLGDVAPRAGGTLIVSGSHRLVHKQFADDPPSGTRGAEYRQLLLRHPYLRDLHTEGDADERAARFMGRAEDHDGIPLRVVENTGMAGDVILLHPLVLHVATSNTGTAPRFLLSGGVDLPSMWGARDRQP